MTWEVATAVAGRVLGINPFDQPDVESAKTAARGLLDEQPAEEPAQITDDGIEVRGSAGLLDGVDTLAGAVDALLVAVAADGYLAVMAYLDSERDAALHGGPANSVAAHRAADHLRLGSPLPALDRPVPQGRAAPGRLPADHVERADDVEIPDRPFTFRTLITAQAAGDANVLADHGRPVLRLHVNDPSSAVTRLIELLR